MWASYQSSENPCSDRIGSNFKIPPSQRRGKPLFSVRFLVVGVPYHSGYLSGVTEKLVEDLDEELWDAEDLKIPVFHTEDGMLRVYGLPYPRVNIC